MGVSLHSKTHPLFIVQQCYMHKMLCIPVSELVFYAFSTIPICPFLIQSTEKGGLFQFYHIVEKAEWDFRSEPLDSKEQTVLHIACAIGRQDIAKYLVFDQKYPVTVEDVLLWTYTFVTVIDQAACSMKIY